MTTEVWCRKCSTHGFLKRQPRDHETCPTCDAPLFKRREGSPTPWNHFGAVVRALFSFRGILFVAGYVAVVQVPHPVLRVAAAVLLFLGATTFAARSASVGVDRHIDFPHINLDELLSIKAIVAMSIYVVVLVLGPLILMGSAVASLFASDFLGEIADLLPPVPVAVGAAVLLVFWAPMALVLYLRTRSPLGFFLVPQGIRLIYHDLGGYAAMASLVIGAQAMLALAYVLNSFVPFFLGLGVTAVKAFLILGAYGIAGLYIREHARVLDFPVDDDDWVPVSEPVDVHFRDVRSFRPTNPSRAIELSDDVLSTSPSALGGGAPAWGGPPAEGSWPPRPALAEERPAPFVPDEARAVGLEPLPAGEWLSAEDGPHSPASQDGPALPALGKEHFGSNENGPAAWLSDASSPVGFESGSNVSPSDFSQHGPAADLPAPVMPAAADHAHAQAPSLSSLPLASSSVTETHQSSPDVTISASEAPLDDDTRLGRYRLRSKIAEGGMAEIYFADQVGPQDYRKPVIVKRMRRQLVSEDEVVGMFLDEARLGAQLNHPNIVQVIDFGEAHGEYFIAMERLRGADFGELLQHGAVDVGTACLLISQACDGLEYAHQLRDEDGNARGIVHRDVSPANLFLAMPGVVKVLDFGIARATERSTKTQTGMVKGKPAFMSPEQVRGQPLDGRSDVFSLGTTLYQLVTGVNPFFRDSDFDTGAAVVQERQPELSTFPIEFPPGFEAALKGALRKHVEKRYSSAREFRDALRPFLPPDPSAEFLAQFLQTRSK